MSAWLLEGHRPQRPGQELRQLLDEEHVLTVVGAFNPLVGLIARRVGFKTLHFSGAAYTATLALPDLGLLTLDNVARAVGELYRATGLPIIVDGDTGFGEVLNVTLMVEELERAGAAAVHIEDQELPKRCGHLPGKVVIPAEDMARKVAAAARARRDLIIIARTDARAVYGFEEAVRRAKLYLEAGADIAFADALESEEELKAWGAQLKCPLLIGMTEFGKTPYIPIERIRQWGYKTIVIFPVTALRVAAKAVEEVFITLRDKGTQVEWLERMQTRQDLYELIGYWDYERFDQELAGLFEFEKAKGGQ